MAVKSPSREGLIKGHPPTAPNDAAAAGSHAIATYGGVLRLAWPASVAASITPLLGAVDVWALARSDRPLDVAAVGLAAALFSLVYWAFGFIRMSVAGLTAQASGAHDKAEERTALLRGLIVGSAIGLCLTLAQWPISKITFPLMALGSEVSDETLLSAQNYFFIRIWGAPFTLGAYAMFGWLTAKGRTDYLMAASMLMTGLNIILDYWFVIGLGWGAAGVAFGTVIAETIGFIIAGLFIIRIVKSEGATGAVYNYARLLSPAALSKTISVNRDIFIRTLLLAISFSWFVQRGGAFGDVTLAANQVLLQLFLFTGLALDGTAIAAETYVGRAIGDTNQARRRQHLRAAVKTTMVIAIIVSIIFAAMYGLAGARLIALLTPEPAIQSAALTYLIWIALSPLFLVIGFQLDGIFIGATRAREMRNSMIICVLFFWPASLWLAAHFGNHGLWAAFLGYFLLRAITLGFSLPRIFKHGAGK